MGVREGTVLFAGVALNKIAMPQVVCGYLAVVAGHKRTQRVAAEDSGPAIYAEPGWRRRGPWFDRRQLWRGHGGPSQRDRPDKGANVSGSEKRQLQRNRSRWYRRTCRLWVQRPSQRRGQRYGRAMKYRRNKTK